MKAEIMTPAILTLIATLTGAIVGSAGTILVTWINNRSAERRHFKELVFTIGSEKWKEALQFANQQKGRIGIAPMDDFILGTIISADLFFSEDITEDNIEEILARADTLSEKINNWRFKDSRQARD